MKGDTLIEHKEAVIICEENGPINLSYNVQLTTLEANIVVKLVIPIVTTKSTLTYTNCGKINHLVKIYHNRKREVPILPTAKIKSTYHVARTKTQLVKSRRIPIRYPYIIYLSGRA
jgi:hypothetical protein